MQPNDFLIVVRLSLKHVYLYLITLVEYEPYIMLEKHNTVESTLWLPKQPNDCITFYHYKVGLTLNDQI